MGTDLRLFDSFERGFAERTLWSEARGEGPVGMEAVGHVLLNRLASGRWGKTIGAVCMWPWQFSCWNLGDPNRGAVLEFNEGDLALRDAQRAWSAAVESHATGDSTGGATHYYNPAGVSSTPTWTLGATKMAEIGHHLFFSNVK